MKLELAATCLFGLEHSLGEEIDALGYTRTETIDGRVYFTGDETAVARMNVFSRFAERVMIVVGKFDALTFDELFEGTKSLPWELFIGCDDKFPVKGHSVKSALFSVPDCQRIINKAVADRLSSKYGVSTLPETGALCQIVFFILKDRAALMIDTSGAALHKRGYRPESNIAPLRETLAAEMVKISRPREDVLFWDPMCGSGTIAIEAAMKMQNRAPGMMRRFAAERFSFIDRSVFKSARSEAHDLITPTDFEVYASDIDEQCVSLTLENAKRAGVSKNIKVFVRDALTIKTEGRRGTIVTNPPYGERMGTKSEVAELYRQMGRHFRTLDNWQIYIISSCEDFPRLYGQHPDKIKKLYNGMIPYGYYQFFKRHDKK
ncbi:MAG: class I SAM-dependent RNA methyltransferase [Firmicutes bacterium]|nr:class I SAM-dependent RNA methyltransferase [Bacillota bacterium]